MPKHAVNDSEIETCCEVMLQLRPHVQREKFVEIVRNQETEGYKLAYIEDNNTVVAVAGYRICSNLFMGKHLYVDDLVTLESARSQGYGKKLLSWLRNIAITEDCNYFHLDSGTHRTEAHKFYFREGLSIASFHFSENLKK